MVFILNAQDIPVKIDLINLNTQKFICKVNYIICPTLKSVDAQFFTRGIFRNQNITLHVKYGVPPITPVVCDIYCRDTKFLKRLLLAQMVH
jgi:hypothetical protein